MSQIEAATTTHPIFFSSRHLHRRSRGGTEFASIMCHFQSRISGSECNSFAIGFPASRGKWLKQLDAFPSTQFLAETFFWPSAEGLDTCANARAPPSEENLIWHHGRGQRGTQSRPPR